MLDQIPTARPLGQDFRLQLAGSVKLMETGKDNLLDPAAWKKNPLPVFKQKPGSGVYAPGHNSFFKSPDGKENWILYHANAASGQGCGKYRSPRAQKFTFNRDGIPDFGEPVKADLPLQVPSQNR